MHTDYWRKNIILISKDPEAHEHFIQITEAYESLMSYSNVHDETTSYSWDDYNNEEELRRKRAREYAQMKYRVRKE